MKFKQYHIGHQQRGNVVEVTLSGSAANVRLLDSGNLQNYKSGRKHRYYGGLVTRSPTRLVIPHTGTWYVTVDLQGIRGQVRSSVRVIPSSALSPLPEYRPPSMSDLVRPVSHGMPDTQVSGETSPPDYYDVFISHATEDKDAVARPIATCLVSHGLRVWYDEFELRIGDSIRRKIDQGVARSRFGVIVISPSFLRRTGHSMNLMG